MSDARYAYPPPPGSGPGAAAGGAYLTSADASDRHGAARAAAAQHSVAAAAPPAPASPLAALAGFLLTGALTEPLDRLRFVLQTQALRPEPMEQPAVEMEGKEEGKEEDKEADPQRPPPRLGLLSGLRHIARRERRGALALWTGAPSSVALSISTFAVRGAVTALYSSLGLLPPGASRPCRVAGALLVGYTGALLAAPLAVGRASVLQTGAPAAAAAYRRRSASMLRGIRSVYRSHGAAGLLAGLPAQAAGLTAYVVASVALSAPPLVVAALGAGVPPGLIAAVSAPLAGVAALPFDTIRAVQLCSVVYQSLGEGPGDSLGAAAGSGGATAAAGLSFVEAARAVLAAQGVPGLFSGAVTRALAVVVGAVVGRLVAAAQ